MLEDRSQRSTSRGAKTSTGAVSRGVLFPPDLAQMVEDFTNEHFPLEEWPTLKVGHVITGLMYAGVKNEDAPEIVAKYIAENAPNSKVNKAAKAIDDLTPEEKQALIKRLGLA